MSTKFSDSKLTVEEEMKIVESSSEHEQAETDVVTLDARELLGTRGLLRIDLDGELYTLRMTRNNRLILTK